MNASRLFRNVALVFLMALTFQPQAAPILDSFSSRISYQGFLNSNGAPANGTFNFRFQLYTEPGGIAIGAPIDVVSVAVTNGLFHALVPFPASSFDGSGRAMGIRVNLGAELSPRQSIGARPYAMRVDRVASEELDDTIALGRAAAPFATGTFNVHNGLIAQESIELVGSAHRISTYGSDGLEQIRLWGPTFGELFLNDNTGNDRTVLLTATSNGGGQLHLTDGNGLYGLRLLGQSTTNGAEISVLASNGTETIEILGSRAAAQGGQILIRNSIGTNTIELNGDSVGAGLVSIRNTNGAVGIGLDGAGAGAGGEIVLFDNDGTETVEIRGAEDSATGSQIALRNSAGANAIVLDAEFTAGGPSRINTDELHTTGELGVGRDPAVNILEVEGNASKTTAGSWLANSDARIKTDIETIRGALDTLERVRLVSFRYTDEYRQAHPSMKDRRYLNVVAQEFRAVFPDDVKGSGERLADGSEILQVDTYPLTIYATAAIQELNQKLADELLRRDTENADLRKRLERLEQRLNAKVDGSQ